MSTGSTRNPVGADSGERVPDAQRPAAGAGRFAVRRPARRSRGHPALRWGIGLAVVAALSAGVWWLRTAATFSVVRVESGAYRFTAEKDLEEILTGFLGRNIWTLGGDEIRAALEPLPWVRDLRVRRRLPATIEVDFREWRPLLEVAGLPADPADTAWVLIADGRILPYPGHLVLAGLPVLTGVKPAAGERPGQWRLEPEEAARVLDLHAAVTASALESIHPVDFVALRPEGYAIILQDEQGILLVGREEFGDRLGRYMEAHEHLEPGLIVDLRFRDRITCRRPQQERGGS